LSVAGLRGDEEVDLTFGLDVALTVAFVALGFGFALAGVFGFGVSARAGVRSGAAAVSGAAAESCDEARAARFSLRR
jgi:hypothetical protein